MAADNNSSGMLEAGDSGATPGSGSNGSNPSAASAPPDDQTNGSSRLGPGEPDGSGSGGEDSLPNSTAAGPDPSDTSSEPAPSQSASSEPPTADSNGASGDQNAPPQAADAGASDDVSAADNGSTPPTGASNAGGPGAIADAPAGSVAGVFSTLADAPRSGISLPNEIGHEANAAVAATAAGLGLPNTGGGVDDTSTTAGIGQIGDSNLITEAMRAPGDVLGGERAAAEVSDLIRETGRTVSATGDAIQAVGIDIGNPNLAQNLAGGLNGAATGLADGIFNNGNEGTLVSAGAGTPGSNPIINPGILHTAPGNSPVGIAVGDPGGVGNVADVQAADGSNGSIVSGDAGSEASPIALAGILTNTDSTAPVGADIGNGTNVADASLLGTNPLLGDVSDGLGSGPLGGILGDGNGSAVTADAGRPGDMPLANAGLLADPTMDSPLGVDAVGGPNMVNVEGIGSAPHHAIAALSANGDNVGLGNIADASALGNGIGNIISGDVGTNGGSPLAVASILTDPTSTSPIAAQFGNGQNVADASLLGDSSAPQSVADGVSNATGGVLGDQNGKVVSGDAGFAGGSPLAAAGVLTDPSPSGPVGVDALSGPNAVMASLSGNSDMLNFPNLAGSGTDSLNGVAPGLPEVADAGSVVGEEYSGGNSLIDVGTDASLVQIHDDHSSLVGLNHAAVI